MTVVHPDGYSNPGALAHIVAEHSAVVIVMPPASAELFQSVDETAQLLGQLAERITR